MCACVCACLLQFKLCKVRKLATAIKGVPYVVTHDGRTIRYPDPHARVDDTVKIDLETGSITQVFKFDVGALVMITGGRNQGRVGTLVHRDRNLGSFDIVHIRDSTGHEFATRLTNVFVIGTRKDEKNVTPITLPRGHGIKLSIAEERDRRLKAKAKESA